MIKVQAVRAIERAASDGEFWVFFFFFHISSSSSQRLFFSFSWRRGASAAAAQACQASGCASRISSECSISRTDHRAGGFMMMLP